MSLFALEEEIHRIKQPRITGTQKIERRVEAMTVNMNLESPPRSAVIPVQSWRSTPYLAGIRRPPTTKPTNKASSTQPITIKQPMNPNAPLLFAAASGFLSRVQTDTTHRLALRDVACFVLPQSASLSLSLAGDALTQGRVDYALYAPTHSEKVSWSQSAGFEIHAMDTHFFAITGSIEASSEARLPWRVAFGELSTTERYCLKTNYYDKEGKNALAPAAELVPTVENGHCYSGDQREAILFLAKVASSLLISTVVYLTDRHSSMIIWREFSSVLFAFLCLPFVYHDTALCSSLSSVLQNVLMVLYYPVSNTWTPLTVIISMLEPVIGPEIPTIAVPLLLLSRFVLHSDDARYSSVGPVILVETMCKRYFVPLLLIRPSQELFVSGLEYTLMTLSRVPNGYMCGYALEWDIFEVCLKSLLIVVMLLVT